nr:YjiH family protein [Natranaerovirga pectinivora]
MEEKKIDFNNPQNQTPEKNSFTSLLKFIIPSVIGILLFMIPIPYDDGITVPIAIVAKYIINTFEASLPAISTIIIIIAVLLSIVATLFKPAIIQKNKFLNNLFSVSPMWLTFRILGMVFAVLTLLEIGPSFVWSADTGGLLLEELIPTLFSVFLFAGLLLPLLLNFGLLEFFGTLLTKVMRPLFKLPGRSSIDCITSWLGDGTLGILLTNKQYEEGHYTKREAAVIATTFSAVSITFSLVVINTVGLGNYFVPFYLTVTFAGVVAALIVPRIRPLSKKANTYIDESTSNNSEEIPTGYNMFNWGIKKATQKADENTSISSFFIGGIKNVLDMWLGVMPIVMAFGTIALIITEFTPIFTWLGYPFVPILNLLGVPEASEAAMTFVVGFGDMFLPALIGSGIESELTRFVIACTSVTQLIYMSEVGGLLLGSKLPINLKDLIIIFIQRTLITLPIIVAIAHLIF